MSSDLVHVAAGLITKNGKVLVELSENKDFYKQPGGKIEPGESPQRALARELKEELEIDVDEADLEPIKEFYEQAKDRPNLTVHMHAFKVNKYKGDPQLGHKVVDIKYIDIDNSQNLPLGNIIQKHILPLLKWHSAKHKIHKAGGNIIKDKKLLVVKAGHQDFFIEPGGKIEKGESVKQSLIREIKEELNVDVMEQDLESFGEFYAPAAGQEHVMLRMDVFNVKKWNGELSPTSEIAEMAWITSDYPKDMELGSILIHHIIPKLKTQGLID